MKTEDLFKQIEETLSQASGEVIEVSPAQFFAYVQAHTELMKSEDGADQAIERAKHLVEVLDLAKNFESSETVALPMLTGELAVQAQTAWRDFGERSVTLVSGEKAGFIDKASKIKDVLESFVKANTEGADDGDGESDDDKGQDDDKGGKSEDDGAWPSNFNAGSDGEDEINFGEDKPLAG